jgi:hypothetical protein
VRLSRVYRIGMTALNVSDSIEKLIRLRANRRGQAIDLRVHYEVSRVDGCDTYRIIAVDEID